METDIFVRTFDDSILESKTIQKILQMDKIVILFSQEHRESLIKDIMYFVNQIDKQIKYYNKLSYKHDMSEAIDLLTVNAWTRSDEFHLITFQYVDLSLNIVYSCLDMYDEFLEDPVDLAIKDFEDLLNSTSTINLKSLHNNIFNR